MVSATPAPSDLGRSWWLREALALPGFAGEPAPALAADTTADVVILGGGYTGMWTAWFLKERDPGIDIVLLEADICGGGPSGRNGGFLDSWWGHIADLVATYGEDGAEEPPARVRAIALRRSAPGARRTVSTPGSARAAISPSRRHLPRRAGGNGTLDDRPASRVRRPLPGPVPR